MLLRFAPSPTGFMHLGNARIALMCYLYARSQGGKIVLRIDDTDTARSEEKYVSRIKKDVSWLGIKFDDVHKQSDRNDVYSNFINKLKNEGRIYQCYETEEELSLKRKAQLNMGKPPIYDRSGALDITADQLAKYEKEGRRPYWRYQLDNKGTIKWIDEVMGEISFTSSKLSDPVVIRANGIPTYMLPSVIDDLDMGITHIVRGEDHLSNTAIQIQMLQHLGANIPKFAHVALLCRDGHKLSKGKGELAPDLNEDYAGIGEYRERGIEPMAVNNYIFNLGISKQYESVSSIDQLVSLFNINNLTRSKININVQDIYDKFNHKTLSVFIFDDIKGRLEDIDCSNITDKIWNLIKGHINYFADVKLWKNIIFDKIDDCNDSSYAYDGDFLCAARDSLPAEPWGDDIWKAWINNIKNAINEEKIGKKLIQLRKAITSYEKGPEMSDLVPLIGRSNILHRINNIIKKPSSS